jgi:hypothetical protein
MELTVEGYKIGQPFMSRTVVATVVAGQVTPVEVPF